MLVLDASDAVYVTGTGGPNPSIGTPPYLKGVVAKYNSDGTPQWTVWDAYANGKAVVLGEGNTLATLGFGYLVTTHYTETGQTDVLPAAPTNLAASAAFNWIDLSFVDHADNEFFVEVEHCTGSGCNGFSMIGRTYGENSNGFRDTDIVTGVTYTYRVRAMGFMGASAYSNTAEASYGANPPAAPRTTLTTAMSEARVVLNWQDNSTNESQFYIGRHSAGCRGARSSWAWGRPSTNVTTWTDYNAAAGQSYAYRVRAWNLDGFSGYSNTSSIVTPNGSPSPPLAPGNLAAQALNTTPDPADLDEQQRQPGPREGRALPRRRLHQLAPDRHRGGNGKELHELGSDRIRNLPVPRARSQLSRRFALSEHGLGKNRKVNAVGQSVAAARAAAGRATLPARHTTLGVGVRAPNGALDIIGPQRPEIANVAHARDPWLAEADGNRTSERC